MNTKTLKTRIEKAGFEVIEVAKELYDHFTHEKSIRKEYFVTGLKYNIHWFDDEGCATCVYVKKNGKEDDLMTDYHCGWFGKTIKEVINALKEI